MLDRIKQFFSAELTLTENDHSVDTLQMAAAALLIELSRADYQQDETEQQEIESALQNCFGLDTLQLSKLIELATLENSDATSLYQFTRLIKDNYSPQQRFELVTMLWQVAVADGKISKYEDHLIRKIAELIYLPHSEFIRAKLAVLKET